MSEITLEQEIEMLRRENTNLKAKKEKVGLKVSEKGALSVYGLGRFPVTLYKEQWMSLFGRMEDIKKFLEENEKVLSVKK